VVSNIDPSTSLYDAVKDGIALTDMNGLIKHANQAFCDIVGYTLEELQELTYVDITPEDWQEMEYNILINEVLPNGCSDEYEKEYLRKDGTRVPISIRSWVIKDDDGNNSGMWALVRDITEQKKHQVYLKLQDEIVSNMSEGVYVINADTDLILFANPKFEQMFGYEPGEMNGRPVSMVNAPRPEMSSEETKDLIVGILRDTGKWQGEIENIKKDGTTFWCWATATMFRNEDKNLIVSVHQDITESKLAKLTADIMSSIIQVLQNVPNGDMYHETLSMILEVLNSPYGVFGYFDNDKNALVCPSMTRDIWDECEIPDKNIVFSMEEGSHGPATWIRAFKEKRTYMSNKPSVNVPDGHIPIKRHIATPIIHLGEAIGIIEVANKPFYYTGTDIKMMESIAAVIAPVLYARMERDKIAGALLDKVSDLESQIRALTKGE
jgi:PAS domain S-box-containing protein